MTSSMRNEILNILAKKGPLTVLEISRELNLTKADIRYHIKLLKETEEIETLPPLPGGKGRPASRFKPVKSFYPDNLATLLKIMFKVNPLSLNNLDSMASEMANSFDIRKDSPTFERLNKLVQNLTKLNYSPRWEVFFTGPQVMFFNCPYRKVIHDAPELCELDRLIIEKSVNRKTTIRHNILTRRKRFCSFQISS